MGAHHRGLSLICQDIRYFKTLSFVAFRALSHTRVMDYDEACFMHLAPGVVHNFPKAVVV